MSLPEIRDLARQIERSSPSNTSQQSAILARLREMSKTMKAGEARDLAGCLDAASLLSEYLTQMGGIGPDGILRVVLRLVNVVRDAFEEDELEKASEQPDSSLHETSAARRGWTPLQARRDDDSSLRLVSDLVLGEVLVQLGHAKPDQVDRALRVHRATGRRIGEALVEIGAVTWDQIEHGVRVQDHLRRGFDPRSVG
jgi:hypothetical protein